MKSLSVQELASQPDSVAQKVDVRSASEFASGHIPGAVHIPMEEVASRLADISSSRPIVLICKSGTRAEIVGGFLRQCRQDVNVLEGGTAAWAGAGNPLVMSAKTTWSLERQVRLIGGLLVFAGTILAVTLNPYWVYLCGLIGAGLTFAGLSDICPMGMLLGKMPWNAPQQCKTPPTEISKAPGLV